MYIVWFSNHLTMRGHRGGRYSMVTGYPGGCYSMVTGYPGGRYSIVTGYRGGRYSMVTGYRDYNDHHDGPSLSNDWKTKQCTCNV
jgi:hypothetical protein